MALGKLPELEEDDSGAIFAEINITPLTDIFLVMLIIFMVASSTAVDKAMQTIQRSASQQSSGLKVNLPEGAAKEIDPQTNSLVVGILEDGRIMVNGQEVSDSDLDAVFESAAAKDTATQVVLKADTGVSHGRVVGVMERAKAKGLSRLAIATKGAGG